MVYDKNAWKDRIVQNPLTYTLQNNPDGTVTLIPAEGTITQTGTPITADVMNHLETQYDEVVKLAQMYKLTMDNGISISFTGDLDTLFSPGRYYLSGTATHRPLNNTATGLLIVDQLVSSNGWFQCVKIGSGRTLIRYYTGGAWGDWLEYVLLTKDGILNIPTQPYFYASTGTDTAISSGVDTKIVLPAENNDTYGEFTNGQWKPKETGVYMIGVSIAWKSVINGTTTFKLYNGGTSSLNMDLGNNTKIAAFSRPLKVTGGTTFDFYIAQDSGASQTLDLMVVYITKIS